jgi:hypothetical protein
MFHTASLAGLDEAMSRRPGVLLLTGEPRTGRTALVNTFTRRMQRDGLRVETLRAVPDAPLDVSYAVRAITGCVRALVVIDDAHTLPRAVFDQIDALFVPDRTAGMLVHILLAGQPGLATTVAGTALAERVTVHCHLPPLPAHEWTEPDDLDHHQPSRWWRFPGADLAGAVLGAIAFLAVALGIVAYSTPLGAPQTAAPTELQASGAERPSDRTLAHAASPGSEPEPALSFPDDQVAAVEPRETLPTREARSTPLRTSISEAGGGASSGGRRLQLPPRPLEWPTGRRESPASPPPPASPPRRPPRLDQAHDPAAVIDWLVNHAAVARGHDTR